MISKIVAKKVTKLMDYVTIILQKDSYILYTPKPPMSVIIEGFLVG